MIVENVWYGETPICKIYQNGILIWSTYVDYLYAIAKTYLGLNGQADCSEEDTASTLAEESTKILLHAIPGIKQFDWILAESSPSADSLSYAFPSVEEPTQIGVEAGGTTKAFAKLIVEGIEEIYMKAGLSGVVVGISDPSTYSPESLLLNTSVQSFSEITRVPQNITVETTRLLTSNILRTIASAITYGCVWGGSQSEIDTDSGYANVNIAGVFPASVFSLLNIASHAMPEASDITSIRFDASCMSCADCKNSLIASEIGNSGTAYANQMSEAIFDLTDIEKCSAPSITKFISYITSLVRATEGVLFDGSIYTSDYASVAPEKPLSFNSNAISSIACCAGGCVISTWIDPVQSGANLYIKQVYESLQTDSTLSIR